MNAIDALIQKIDERGEELTTTWKRLGDHPQELIVPEAMRQALHELGWIHDELVAISEQEQQAVKTFAEKVKSQLIKNAPHGMVIERVEQLLDFIDTLLSESSRENQK